MPIVEKERTESVEAQAERRYFDRVEVLPRAELLKLQEKRLLEQVAYVAERSPLVKRVWADAGVAAADIRSTEDFKAKVPFTDKDSLRQFRDATGDKYGGVLCADESEIDLVGTSSGTTGDPTIFGESWTAPGDYLFSPREAWELGLRPGDYFADVGHTLRSIGRLYYHDAGAVPVFFDHDASDLPRFVEWSLKYRPTWMFHLSSPLIYGLARLEAETGVDLRDVFSSYTAVIYGGEPMGKQARELVTRWQVPVYEFTSLGDSGTGWECREKTGFHAWEDLVLFEVIDPDTLEPVPSGGRGEMVVTNMVDRMDPLIRFRSSDFVEWTEEKCGCGRTHARFWPLGRVGDELVVAGRSVMPRDVWDAIEQVPETASGLFQIIRPQREVEVLKLRVGYEGSPDLADLDRRVADSVEEAIGVRPIIEFTPNSEIIKLGPPHKIPRTAKQ
jgi:phenylacetate-CoA ligase